MKIMPYVQELNLCKAQYELKRSAARSSPPRSTSQATAPTHVASRELKRRGGDVEKVSIKIQAAITAAASDSTEPYSAV